VESPGFGPRAFRDPLNLDRLRIGTEVHLTESSRKLSVKPVAIFL